MMNPIDKYNYETYVLDFMEGRLCDADRALFLAFLEHHPDIKAELAELDLVYLEAKEQTLMDKSILLKKIDAENIEPYIIAAIESELNDTDAEELYQYLQTDKEAHKLAERYQKTKLVAPKIEFPNKSALKRHVLTPRIVATTAGIAATIAIAIILVLRPGKFDEQGIQAHQVSGDVVDSSDMKRFIATQQPNLQGDESGAVIEPSGSREEPDAKSPPSTPPSQNQVKSDGAEKLVLQSVSEKNIALAEQHKKLVVDVDNSSDSLIETSPNIQSTASVQNVDKADSLALYVKHGELLASRETKENAHPAITHEALTLHEWTRSRLRQNILKTNAKPDQKVSGQELLIALAENTSNSSPADFDYQVSENRTSYRIAIGKFEFSRTKSH